MLTHVGTQTIETERLILRRFEYTDIDSMLRNWISDEKTQYDYGEPYYPTPEAVKSLFDTKYIVSYSKDDYYNESFFYNGIDLVDVSVDPHFDINNQEQERKSIEIVPVRDYNK